MKLEEEILADRAAIAHHLAHLAALARGHEKAAALAEGHKTRGIDSAVEAFVRLTVKETVNKEDGTTEVKAIGRVSKRHLGAAHARDRRDGHERAWQEEAQCDVQGQPRPDGLRGDE